MRETYEETGLHVRLTDLAGVYTKPATATLILTFSAEIVGGQPARNDEAAAFSYFAPGSEPANSVPKQVERAADAVGPRQKTLFRVQTEPSADLKELAQRARGDDKKDA